MFTLHINSNTYSRLLLNTSCCQIQEQREHKVTILFTTLILLQPLSCLSAAAAASDK